MAKPNGQVDIVGRRVCGNCYHWGRLPDRTQSPGEDIIGECMLSPPKVIDVDDDGAIVQCRPMVDFSERCGQHQHQVN